MKKMYARQRAKDLAEHAKSLMSKEKELEDLKKQLVSQQNDQVLPVSFTKAVEKKSIYSRITIVSDPRFWKSPKCHSFYADFLTSQYFKSMLSFSWVGLEY